MTIESMKPPAADRSSATPAAIVSCLSGLALRTTGTRPCLFKGGASRLGSTGHADYASVVIGPPSSGVRADQRGVRSGFAGLFAHPERETLTDDLRRGGTVGNVCFLRSTNPI